MTHVHTRASVLDAPPISPASRMLRAGADDRQRVLDLLQGHYVAGRLDASELEERIERTLSARTLADLDVQLADLPPIEQSGPAIGQPRRRERHGYDRQGGRRGRKPFTAQLTSYLLVMILLVTIWLLTTPGGYFWPVWPMLGWGIGLASHGLAARSTGHQDSALVAR